MAMRRTGAIYRVLVTGALFAGLHGHALAADSPTAEFRPVTRAELSTLRAGAIDRSETRPRLVTPSDLMVQVVAASGASGALAGDGGAGTQRTRMAFAAHVMAVVEGRLHAGASARCRPWQADLAQCFVECDGGIFGLRRLPGQGGERLQFELGPDLDPEGGAGAISLTGCSETGADMQLMPASGEISIALTRD